MPRRDRTKGREKEGGKILTVLIALLIAVIWFAIFGLLIKLDVGGFGSGVLRPIIKDVPIINKILPSIPDEQLAMEKDYAYSSLAEAVARIKELEANIEVLESSKDEGNIQIADLLAELDRLRVFEEKQNEFEERQKEFDKKVVFADAAPDINEYKQFYEGLNPANAETLYRQVVEQLQYSEAILEKANIYRTMDSKAAARILETMTADVESVAKILLAMRPRESAGILAEMDYVLAARITKKMLDMDEERLAGE